MGGDASESRSSGGLLLRFKKEKGSPGDSVRLLRALQDMSQNDLAAVTGIAQPTISAIENGRVRLGVDRAKVLGKALRCHHAVLVFPGWDVEQESAA